jgi:cell division septation protein DedD
VVRLDLRQATPAETARLEGGGTDYWLAVSWVPPERIPAAIAAAESASVAQDSALVTNVAPTQPDSVVMYLQVSRTQNAEWAQLLMRQLKGDGYPASILDPSEPEDGYRVVVGPFSVREAADSVGRAMGRPYFVLRLPAKKP